MVNNFFETTAETIAARSLDPAKTWYGTGLYNADGSLARVVHDYGQITAIGTDAVFYLGSGAIGNVITPTGGYSYGDSATFTNMDRDVTTEDLATYSSFGPGVLAPGEVYDPTAVPDPDSESAPDVTASQSDLSIMGRVLSRINNSTNLAKINGTYVNLAENLGGASGDGIDGSINNIVNGVTAATLVAVSGATSALEYRLPTFDFGNMATTTLGAVNTGDIVLGVNQSVDEAKTTATGADSAVGGQIGGSSDTGALVLNVAANMTGINGSINNAMTGVAGSIGTMSTTTLGAVNTGAITSGVNAAVNGIVGVSGTKG